MAKIKETIKAITPPLIISAIRGVKNQGKTNEIFSGNYRNWQEAKKQCTGYENERILQKCRDALLKVKNGEAVYERDSVLFDEIQYSWPLLASLQKIAIDNHGELTVLDFGGSLGSSYFQNKQFLNGLERFHWCIVEQPHFVKAGKNEFEDEHLKFYETIEACLRVQKPDVLLLSSVLQYLSDPYKTIREFISLGVPCIIIDRTGFTKREGGMLSVQNIPPEIYEANYPAWFFNEKEFIASFSGMYNVVASFPDSFANPLMVNGDLCYWKGFFLIQTNGC